MKSKARFLPFVIALALVTSMFVFSPASAATGTVSLDKSFITTPGGTLTITLADDDLNTGVEQADELAGRDITDPTATATYRLPVGVLIPANGELRFRTRKSPILDSSGDGAVDFQDVTLALIGGQTDPLATTTFNSLTSLDVGGTRNPFDVFSVGGGIFVLRNFGAAVTPGANIDFQVTYTAPDVQQALVKVASTQDAAGYNIVLVETGASTGSFTGTFNTAALTANAIDISGGIAENDPTINLDLNGDNVIDGTVVNVTTEANIGIDLDGDGALEAVATTTSITASLIPNGPTRPSIASVTGALITVTYDDGGTSRVANATVETTMPTITILAPSHETATRTQSTRLIAEVTDADSGVDNDTVNFIIDLALTSAGAPVGGPGVTTIARTVTSIPGGVRIEAQFDEVPQGENIIDWHVTATDKAGNVAASDQNGDASDGDQDHQIRIDTVAPALGTIVVGVAPNQRTVTGAITGHSLDGDNNAVVAADSADATFVRVVFNEALNQNSIQASDFRVGGVTPAAVEWSSNHPESVFLKVPTRAADAKPVVDVVGAVEDRALNAVPGGLTATALDGIAPTVVVTLSPNSALGTGTFTIDMQSDESLLTAPVITINGNEGGSGVGGGDLGGTSLVGANLFRATFTASTKPMRFNIQIESRDTSDNKRTAGTTKAEDDGSISFEVDNVIPAPIIEFPGGDAGNVFTQNPFIVIEWGSEASEYGRVTDVGVVKVSNTTTDAAFYDTVLDTKSLVTITSITLDGNDVSGNMNRVNNGKFLLALRDVSLAEHMLTFTGQDEAGNTLEVADTAFTVKERPAFDIAMTPGWNLVSLPADPKSGAINDVVPSGHSASIVITYDPTEPGGWLTATRGDDGLFAGTLTEIKASRAYWIFTESFDAISIPLQVIGGGTTNLLPTINLVAGWNLLSVLDVSGTKAFGALVGTPGGYIGTAPVRTYTYNAFADRFDQVTGACAVAGDAGCVNVGVGYWVYMGGAATLVP